MEGLIARADAIVKVPLENLKRRLGDRLPDFDALSKELYTATVTLNAVLKGNDSEKKD